MKELIIGMCAIGVIFATIAFCDWLREIGWLEYVIVGLIFLLMSFAIGSALIGIWEGC